MSNTHSVMRGRSAARPTTQRSQSGIRAGCRPPIWFACLIALAGMIACQPATVTTPTAPANTPQPTETPTARPTVDVNAGATDDTGADGLDAVTPTSGPSPTALYSADSMEGFRQVLIYGINTRNYQYLQYAMTSPFTILDEKGSGKPVQSRDAMPQIQSDLLPRNTTVEFDLKKDITPLLGGKTLQDLFPADANVVNGFYSSGWGKDGKGEAILFINQSAAGFFRWYAVMFASQGFK